MARFFIDLPLSPSLELDLPTGAAQHVRVRRLQPGDDLTLFNGQGGEWSATLLQMGKTVRVQVHAHHAIEREHPRQLMLAQALVANDNMDWIIEKATELGVSVIQPLACSHCTMKLSADRAEKKLQHWQGIIQSACAQSGRNRLPQLLPPLPLQDWLTQLPLDPKPSSGSTSAAEQRLIASLNVTDSAPDQAPSSPVWILIGPEGGFSAAEESAAQKQGFQGLSLGPAVLRAETAALSALARLSKPRA
jgi:16S rRNA (uracil1498-N3)-methyltransferase